MYIGIALNVTTGIRYFTAEYPTRARAKTAAANLKKLHKQPEQVVVIFTRKVKEIIVDTGVNKCDNLFIK